MLRVDFFIVLVHFLFIPSGPLEDQNIEAHIVLGEICKDHKASEPRQLNLPFGIDFDAVGNMYVVKLEGGRVHRLNVQGVLIQFAGDSIKNYSEDEGSAEQATFNGMYPIAVTLPVVLLSPIAGTIAYVKLMARPVSFLQSREWVRRGFPEMVVLDSKNNLYVLGRGGHV